MTLTVYCVPHAGGTERAFVRWRRQLPPELTVRALRIAGKGLRSREPRQRDPERVAADLVAQLDTSEPYVLLGHSLGGLLAFETVRHLLAAGANPPRFLVVAGTLPPHRVRGEHYTRLLELDDDALLDALAEHGAIPEGLRTSPMRRLFTPVVRGDLALVTRYPVGATIAPVPVELRVWYGDRDASTPLSQLAEWRRYTTRPFRLTAFEGGHFFPYSDTAAVARELTVPVDLSR